MRRGESMQGLEHLKYTTQFSLAHLLRILNWQTVYEKEHLDAWAKQLKTLKKEIAVVIQRRKRSAVPWF
jgi:hypothetical protein